ncbi:DUF397 domain-containing protein [Nocardiopsis flavescens]|uniref:DUF397 domain-containing protein n=1 Tax=Nocardiopsis flavescens TaxID=758803 RepID=A0A1M6JCD3_9ACTN|nr:DUF397 domain-containing protein [Nocardiopsis flavescens]SHJ44359.1 protein of unknown function [Nocardiopsis flavescens]
MNAWRKSTYSNPGGNCVEVRDGRRATDVRDTRHRGAGHLSFSRAEWAALVRTARR